MADDMSEKLIFTLPPIRIDEPLYMALMQHAASPAVDRPASYVVREALRAYLESHGRMVRAIEPAAKQSSALRCDAPLPQIRGVHE